MAAENPTTIMSSDQRMRWTRFRAYPSRNHRTSATEKFNLKSVMQRHNNEYNSFFLDNRLHIYLGTVNFDTTYPFCDAWSEAQSFRDRITGAIFQACPEAYFVSTTIEHTHTVPEKHKLQPEDIENPENLPEKKRGRPSKEDQEKKKKALAEAASKKIWLARSTEELLTAVEKANIPERIIVTDPVKYTLAAYNFFVELCYMANSNGVDPDFHRWALDVQDALAEYVRYGESCFTSQEEDPRYFRTDTPNSTHDLLLQIAYLQHDSMTTLGYPHFHFCVCVDAEVTGLDEKFYQIIRKTTPFTDIEFDRRYKLQSLKNKKKRLLGAYEYVLKNHNCLVPYEMFKGYGTSTVIVKTYLPHSRYTKELYDFLISSSPEGASSTFNGKHSVPLYFDLYVTSQAEAILQGRKEAPSTSSIRLVDPHTNKTDELIRFIQDTMIAEGYMINNADTHVYWKIPQSRRSYRYYGTVDEFYARKFLCHMNYSYMAHQRRERVTSLMRNAPDSPDAVYFPRGDINPYFLEFFDFYYCLLTHTIYRYQEDYYCYKYIPQVSLENFTSRMTEFILESAWITQLRASSTYNIPTLAKFAESYAPREQKSKPMLLIGDSNTGKSTAVAPFNAIFPQHLVGTISNITQHIICYQVANKVFFNHEEASTTLDEAARETSNRALVLTLLEGLDGISDKKHGDIEKKRLTAATIWCANYHEHNRFLDYPELLNRFILVMTEQAENIEIKASLYDAAASEAPLVALFLGMCYHARRYNDGPEFVMLPVKDELSSSHRERVESAMRLLSGKIIEDDYDPNADILRHSRRYQRLTQSPLKYPPVPFRLPPGSVDRIPLIEAPSQNEIISKLKSKARVEDPSTSHFFRKMDHYNNPN